MRTWPEPVRLARYAWALPATLIGLALAAPALALGATARVRGGVLEVAGGRLERIGGALRILAIAFGHVVLGVDHALLDRERAHEHAHVRQYERWGPLMIPLYLASSAREWLRGGDAYRDNVFERDACAVAAATSGRAPAWDRG
jgi:hypothetical protein